MPATIKIKNSSTASAVPTSSDLVQGELAVNVTDRRLFTENASGTVVELGTNPTILTMGAAGSASAPVITRTGDTNTGIFFPAADTIAFAEGGTEAMRLDSAGNMGLGVTPNTWAGTGVKAFQFQNGSLAASSSFGTMLSWNAYYDGSYKYTASTTAGMYQVGGAHSWYVAGSGTAGNTISFTQAMTLDASGNLGVGTTSPSYKLHIVGGNATGFLLDNGGQQYTQLLLQRNGAGNTGGDLLVDGSAGTFNIRSLLAGPMVFQTSATAGSPTERARIDSSGNLLVGTTSQISVAGSNGAHCFSTTTTANWASVFQQTSATPLGVAIRYASDSNNTSNDFLYCVGNTTLRASIRSNGGLANFSANNVNLSDERTKTDIQDAGSYLAKICAIPVRTFKYKDQTDDLLNLGVIAQEVETVAPELVDVSGFGETPEDGVPLKAIYQTDLQYALMKALQELKAEFDAYKAAHP